jgi:hypothetical protein
MDAHSQKRLELFLYHKVSPAGQERMAFLRKQYYSLAKMVLELCQEPQATALAMTHLEESCMRAIQSIALVEGKPEEIL